jgi:hypothetical protein
MTSAEARDDLLSMIGVEDPAHASDAILRRIQADINLALQKIWTMASPWWSAGKSGGVLRGPQPISGFPLTKGSASIQVQVPTGNLIVSGAGTEDANGIWTLHNTTVAGKPVWVKGPLSINSDAEGTVWRIANYYQITSSAAMPPASGYTNVAGVSPSPTVAQETIYPVEIFNSSMLGQTVRLGDDPFDNELATYDEATKTATLVRPYSGSTLADGTGMLFMDTIILPDAVMSVIPPVFIAGEHELKPLRSQRDVMLFSDAYNFHSYADTVVGPGSTVIAENRDIDVPVGFYVENYRRASGKTTLRLRVSPLPDKEYALRFDVRLGAPEITALNTTTEIPIPQNYTHSVFIPIVRYHFSTWKHVNLGNQANEYKTHYDEAWQVLAKLKPQPVSVGRVRIVY